MATFSICGEEILFPSVPREILDLYQPTPRTWLFAFKTDDDTIMITLRMLIDTGCIIGAFERDPVPAINKTAPGENKTYRIGYLLEHPSQTVLDHILFFAQATCGTDVYCRCPYADKIREIKVKADEDQSITEWQLRNIRERIRTGQKHLNHAV